MRSEMVEDEEERLRRRNAEAVAEEEEQATDDRRPLTPAQDDDGQDEQPDEQPVAARTPVSPAPPSGDATLERRKEPGFDFLGAIAALTHNPVLADKMRRRDEAPERAQRMELDKNRDAREQGKFELERDMMAPLKAQGLQNKNALGSAQLQAFDPAHPYSKAMREGISQRLAMEAERMPDGNPVKGLMKQAAAGIASNDKLSAMQSVDVAKQFGGIGDRVVKDAHDAASMGETKRMNDAKIGQMSDQSKQAWARIDAARQRALAPRTDPRTRAAQVKNQEKLDDEIEKADWARNNLLAIADLKKHVNTGPIIGRAQNALQEVDLSSPEFDAMKQRLAMVSNRIIKELSGSAVTGNEWARMQDELANILDDDKNFETKLANMIELTETIKQRAINRYARNEQGAPTDTTNTAAMSSGQKPKTLPNEPKPAGPGGKTEPQQNASSKYQIGQTATNKATGEKVRWDGQRWVPLK
jgi:hypothetical protein